MNWDFEEAILLINLYQCWNQQDDENIDDMVSSLSHLLNIRALQLGYVVDDKFRNSTGTKMKLQNIFFIASNGKRGLSGYSEMDIRAYNFSLENPSEFAKKVIEIKRKYISDEPPIATDKDNLTIEKIDDLSLLSELYYLQSEEYEDIDIVGLPISIRVINCLKSAGIKNVEDLLNCNYVKLATIRGFGSKCKNDLHTYLMNITNHELLKKVKAKPITKFSPFIFERIVKLNEN